MKLHWINPQGTTRRVVALGTFDGVHRGHQELMQKTIAYKSKRPEIAASVFTFDYPPEQVLRGGCKRLICDFEAKKTHILTQGIEEVVWTQFTPQFSALPADDFIKEILVEALKAVHIVCGFNFRFGYKAQGTPELLAELGQEYGFTVEVVPPFLIDGEPVSSTRIRNALAEGQVDKAAILLGRYQSYYGEVVDGKKRGRKLGFPTANLKINEELVLPKDGVYFTWAKLPDGRDYPSMTSVSDNPTFPDGGRTVETYILDFNEDLYGQTIELEFIQYMREIQRFSDAKDLQNQLQKDLEYVRGQILSHRLQE